MNQLRLLPALFLLSPALAAQQGSAVFEVTFASTWSAKTHPVQFPSNPHFSPLTGATHKATSSLWRAGGIATPGIEVMAETGGTGPLRTEIQKMITAGGAKTLVSGGGLASPGSQRVRFTVSASHPRFTIVSMLAPSPDWFVGVSGVNLIEKGRWIQRVVIAAHVYDAGTDSGTSYGSANRNTRPQDKIAKVTTKSGPFQRRSTQVGTFTIQRIASTMVYGCGVNPAGSMATSGVPLLGQKVTFWVDDPRGSMMKGAMSRLYFSLKADPGFPCGTKIPGFGLIAPGSMGELLIGNIFGVLGGPTWNGKPVGFPLIVPNEAGAIGVVAYAQGALFSPKRFGLADAAEIHIGR